MLPCDLCGVLSANLLFFLKKKKMSINAVYYPSWRVYKGFPPSALQIDKISHVFYAFARVNEDGTLRVGASQTTF